MAWSKVKNYSLGFNIVDKQFYFYYTLEGESAVHQIFVNASQQAALADMFRNEGPISFNSGGNYFVTDTEMIGEGEVVAPTASQGYSATGVIRGTWLFDLDTGQSTAQTPTADLWWEQVDTVNRRLVAKNGAKLVHLGTPVYELVTLDMLRSADYALDTVDGSSTAANQLTPGSVVGVHTGAGRYAKVQVTSYGYDLGIRWTIY
ncbi:MAG TPA: hypothetical protein VFN43_11760 [Humibacillus sp.]|nr:hypothetical protein [Humibacillus sp.]